MCAAPAARAHDGPHPEPGAAPAEPGRPIVLGLTGSQLGTAAAIGGWLGGSAGLAIRGATAGTGLGLLATIYIAHLVVEAGIAGGVYYFWQPDDSEERDVILPPDDSGRRIMGLGFATGKTAAFSP